MHLKHFYRPNKITPLNIHQIWHANWVKSFMPVTRAFLYESCIVFEYVGKKKIDGNNFKEICITVELGRLCKGLVLHLAISLSVRNYDFYYHKL
jgi:hypothetical protein